jgi:hypothetical protein
MLAWLSLQFVERPFRSRSLIRSRNHVFVLSAGCVAALVLASLLLWQTNGAMNRLSPEAQRVAAGASDFAFRDHHSIKDIPDHLVQLGKPNLPPKVLVWGDSHAMAILPAIDLVCEDAGISAIAATAHSTPPVLEWFGYFESGLNEDAPAFSAAVLDYIKSAAHQGLSHVILAAYWEAYMKNKSTDLERFQAALSRTVREIQAAGCHVVVLIDVPQFPFDPPRALTLNALMGTSSSHQVIDSAQYLADTATQRPILSDLSQHDVTVIYPSALFTDANGIIHPADNGGVLYWDKHHLSTHGSKRLTGIFSTILQSGVRK